MTGGALTTQHGNPLMVIAVAVLVFPRLALGISGFEPGAAVMPQIRGDANDTEDHPAGRIRGTKHLLSTAALIMSAFLATTSFTTVVLIPEISSSPEARLTAVPWHCWRTNTWGVTFGSVYDLSTIAILWFAGAYHRRRRQRPLGKVTPIEYETINRTALTAA